MRVIKIGGRAQKDPALYAAIGDAWKNAGGGICVVHGGGDEVSALQRSMGIEPVFVNGRRATNAADIDVLRMALSGAANKRIVAALQDSGVAAVGISGEDGTLIGAEQVSDTRLGQVGIPKKINVLLLETILKAGCMPVISPMGRSLSDGVALNINGDDSAAAIAGAMRAHELLLIADVRGVMERKMDSGHRRDDSDEKDVISKLSAEGAEKLIQGGSATGGMIAKLEAALLALSSGVRSVRIGSQEMISDAQAGTTITLTPSLV